MSQTLSLLTARHLPVLQRGARTDLLLAFDYDGTLAPLAPTPAAARMRARTRRLLAAVAVRYPCAVVSGRALADVSARLDGIGVQFVFGNHGLESSLSASKPRPQVRRWLPELRRQLADMKGVVIEDKGHSLAVHFRSAPDTRAALTAITCVVGRLPHVRVIHGSASVNLLPRADADKGTALRNALASSGCDTALYVGDDDTDEDAFSSLGADRLISVRIGRSRTSRARFHLAAQDSIDALLELLIASRSDAGAGRIRS